MDKGGPDPTTLSFSGNDIHSCTQIVQLYYYYAAYMSLKIEFSTVLTDSHGISSLAFVMWIVISISLWQLAHLIASCYIVHVGSTLLNDCLSLCAIDAIMQICPCCL